MMNNSKTTGRCPDYKLTPKILSADFKTAADLNIDLAEIPKRITPHELFVRKHSNLLPEGGMFTLPRVPVDINLRSETIDNFSNFIANTDPFSDLLKLLGVDSINIDLLFITLAILNLQFKNTILRSLLGAVFGYSVLMKFLKSREASSDLFMAYSDYLSEGESSDDSSDINMEDVYEPQGFQDTLPIWSSAIMVALHSVVGFKPKDTMLRSLIEITKINDVQRENVSLVIMKVMGGIGTFFQRMEVDNSYTRYFDMETNSDSHVHLFVEESDIYLSKRNAGQAINRETSDKLFKDLEKRGDALLKKLARGSYDRRLVEQTLHRLHSFKINQIGFDERSNGTRQEPVCVSLSGPPGVYKTIASARLATDCMEAGIHIDLLEDSRKHPASYRYVKPSGIHWDGLSSDMFVTLQDDFGSHRDTASSSDTDAQTLINLVNVAPFSPPMAAIENKNMIFFNCKLLILTTNITDWSKLESVTDPKAVERRLHISVKVSVSNKYLNNKGKVDRRKLPHLGDDEVTDDRRFDTIVPNDFWVFEVNTTRANSKSSSRFFTYDELVDLILDRIDEHNVHFKVNARTDLLNRSKNQDRRKQRAERRLVPQSAMSFTTSEFGSPPSPDFLEIYNSWSEVDKTAFNLKFYQFVVLELPKEYSYLFDTNLNLFVHLAERHHLQFHDDVTSCEMAAIFRRVMLIDVRDSLDPTTGIPLYGTSYYNVVKEKVTSFVQLCKSFVTKYALQLGILILLGPPAFQLCRTVFRYLFPLPEEAVTLRNPGVPVKLSAFEVSYEAQSFFVDDIPIGTLPKLVSADLGLRSASTDGLTKILNAYLFTMYYAEKKADDSIDLIRMGLVSNVKGSLFMMNFHFIVQLTTRMSKPEYRGAQVVLATATGSRVYKLSVEDFLGGFQAGDKAIDNDIAFVDVVGSQPQSTGLLRYFATKRDVAKDSMLVRLNCTLVGTHINQPGSGVLIIKQKAVQVRKSAQQIVVNATWTGKNDLYALDNTYSYLAATTLGECGSLLVLNAVGEDNGFIIGVHAAGGTREGFSISLTKEFIEECLEEINFSKISYVEDSVIGIGSTTPIESQGSMLPIATMLPAYTPFTNPCSELQKSKLYNCLPESYPLSKVSPAKLKPFTQDGILIDPSIESLKKFGFQAPAVPNSFVRAAVASYEALITLHCALPLPMRKKFSFTEALGSFGNIKTIDPSTSGGFPHNTPSSVNLKKNYFKALASGDPEEIQIHRSILESSTEECLDFVKQGIRPRKFVYTGNLKDEKLSKKKTKAGSSRFIAGVGIESLILFRMYFGAFMSSYMEATFNVGSANGVNAYSADWDVLARRLSRFTPAGEIPFVGAGDYKAYDGHEAPFVLNQVLNIINRWYGDRPGSEDYVVRTRLWAEIVNPRVLFRGYLYEWFTSMPSGNPMTSIINTMSNNIYFRLAWQVAGMNATTFNDNVFLCCLGDDNIFAVHPDFRDRFNELLMPGFMEKLGMVYTTELKEEAVVPFRDITKTEFLKRTFKRIHGANRWVAPLRVDSIYETLYWTKKKHGEQITADSAATGLREMALHGEKEFLDYYDAIYPLLLEKLPEVHPNGTFTNDHSQVLAEVLDMEHSFYF